MTNTIFRETRGDGPPVLLLHGAGEDTRLLRPQAAALADHGFMATVYDRRGTGRSTCQDWPARGIAGHIRDVVELIGGAASEPVRLLGFSSGGVLALAVAAAHPQLVLEAVAWEPAAVAVLPGAAELHRSLMAPVHAHLEAHPADWAGAYDVMLMSISGGQADLTDPTVAAMRANAEAAVRDDAEIITRHRFAPDELRQAPVVVAVGAATSDLHAAIADCLTELTGRPSWTIPDADDHEVYLHRPDVLAAALRARA